MTRKRKLMLGSLGVMVLILGALGIFRGQFEAMRKSQPSFIHRPELNENQEEALMETEEVPKDLDEDYYDQDQDGNESIYRKVPIDEEVFNILFLGTDVRPDEKGNGRSDSMMLLSYHWEENTLKIISFLRDTWVSIPGKEWNRINAAYAFGGIGLAVNTVNENFELDIQNYAVVQFEGLMMMVDELGGIEVDLTLEEIKILNVAHPDRQIPLKEGTYGLHGPQALTHSRNRRTGDGDFGRTRRQRQVLLAMMDKMRTSLTPGKLSGLLSKTFQQVNTNMSKNQMFSLGLQVLKKGSFQVETARVPFDDTWRYSDKDGRSVVTIDLKENVDLLHQLLYDE